MYIKLHFKAIKKVFFFLNAEIQKLLNDVR